MDRTLERSSKDKVLRRLAIRLKDLGFRRTKSTFFVRGRGLVVEFIHLHKYSFGPKFRIHLGVRVTNDPSDAVALNGPSSHELPQFDLAFREAPETVDRCASEIARYVRDRGEAWFEMWRDTSRLISRNDSPLSADAKAALVAAAGSGPLPERIEVTKQLLGI